MSRRWVHCPRCGRAIACVNGGYRYFCPDCLIEWEIRDHDVTPLSAPLKGPRWRISPNRVLWMSARWLQNEEQMLGHDARTEPVPDLARWPRHVVVIYRTPGLSHELRSMIVGADDLLDQRSLPQGRQP